MKLLNDITNCKLTPAGLIIILAVVVVGLVALIFWISLWLFFTREIKALRDFKSSRNVGSSQLLKQIIDDFREIVSKIEENVNVDSIVDNRLAKQKKIFLYVTMERFLEAAKSIPIVLGLLGTFFGLAGALQDGVDALQSASSVGLFEVFRDPLTDMASAFWTSILGAIVSLVITFLSSNSAKLRNLYLWELDDFLSNEYFYEVFPSEKRFETKNLIEHVSRLCQAFDAMTPQRFSDSVNLFAEKASSLLVSMGDNSTRLGTLIEDFSSVSSGFETSAEKLSSFGKILEATSSTLIDQSSRLVTIGDGLANQIKKTGETMKDAESKFSEGSQKLSEIAIDLRERIDSFGQKLLTYLCSTESFTQEMANNVQHLGTLMNQDEEILGRLINEFRDFLESTLGQQNSLALQMKEASQLYSHSVADLVSGAQGLALSAANFQNSLLELSEGSRELLKAYEGLGFKTEGLHTDMENLMNAWGKALEAFLERFKNDSLAAIGITLQNLYLPRSETSVMNGEAAATKERLGEE